MVNTLNLINDVNEILKNGQVVIFQYYSVSGADSSYDDSVGYTSIGSIATSGLIQSLSTSKYSSDYFLVQQGRALFDDCKLYVNGTVPTGSIFSVKIGSKVYAPIDNGIDIVGLNGSEVYKKIFLRYLPTGSLA